MLKKIRFHLAAKLALALLTTLTLFHVMVVIGVIPYNIVWGGRLKDHDQMLALESMSISINLFLMLIIAVRANYLKTTAPALVLKTFLWLFAALFAFNTLGNLMSSNVLEAIIFTPVTIVLSLLCIRLAIE